MIDVLHSEYFLRYLAVSLAAGLSGVVWFAVRRYFVTITAAEKMRAEDAAVVKKAADTVDKLTDRVLALEYKVNALPTEAMLHQLTTAITAVQVMQQANQSQMEMFRRDLEQIREHLMHTHTKLGGSACRN